MLACSQKCFTPTGHLKSVKNECLWSSVKKRLKQLLAAEKNIYTQAKIVKSPHDMF